MWSNAFLVIPDKFHMCLNCSVSPIMRDSDQATRPLLPAAVTGEASPYTLFLLNINHPVRKRGPFNY